MAIIEGHVRERGGERGPDGADCASGGRGSEVALTSEASEGGNESCSDCTVLLGNC